MGRATIERLTALAEKAPQGAPANGRAHCQSARPKHGERRAEDPGAVDRGTLAQHENW